MNRTLDTYLSGLEGSGGVRHGGFGSGGGDCVCASLVIVGDAFHRRNKKKHEEKAPKKLSRVLVTDERVQTEDARDGQVRLFLPGYHE